MLIHSYERFVIEKKDRFLEEVRDGKRIGESAQLCGTSRYLINKYINENVEFAEEVAQAEVQACEAIEAKLFEMASNGHLGAIKIWLFNRSAGRWKDNPDQFINDINEQHKNKPMAPCDLRKKLQEQLDQCRAA